VEPDEVIALAERYFGPLKPEQVDPPKPRLEPGQRGIKRIMVKVPARQPYLVMGYKTPVVGKSDEAWEPYALEMLAYVLDGGGSARISNNLIRGSKLAVEADAGYSAFSRLPGMLVMDAVPAPDSNVEAVEKALLKEVERFKTELVSEDEIERVRNQIIAAKVYEKDSVFYQAMLIGQLETIGLDWRLADEYVDHLKAVTAEQIRRVAQKYLVENNLSVAVLDPLPMDNSMAKPMSEGVAHAN
jgi:zinc protease